MYLSFISTTYFSSTRLLRTHSLRAFWVLITSGSSPTQPQRFTGTAIRITLFLSLEERERLCWATRNMALVTAFASTYQKEYSTDSEPQRDHLNSSLSKFHLL